jgi:hypothetical protein
LAGWRAEKAHRRPPGLDPKTVRRYVTVAAGTGVRVGDEALSDTQLRDVLLALHPGDGRPRVNDRDRRDEVEARVLKALQEKLLRQDLFEEFCDEFTREMNRLRMEHRASLSSAEHELERVQKDIRRLIEEIKNGLTGPELKSEWNALQERKTALQRQLDSADEPPPLLHPVMAELYRQKVCDLAQALEHPETRTEPADAIRGLVDAIMLVPTEGELRIELKGNLAAMLSAATNAKRSPETGDLSLQVEMVAGAGFELQ